MNGLSEKQKNRYAFIVAVIFIIILLITGTVSWLIIRATSNKVHVVKAGTLDLLLDENSTDGIRLEKEIPKSYRQGLLNPKYTFKLKNNTTIDTKYTITLFDDYTEDDLENNGTITDGLIRYLLVKNGEEKKPVNSKLLSTGRKIDTGVIAGKNGSTPTEISYELYVWIDSKAGDNAKEADIMDRIFSARLKVDAEQNHTEETPTLNRDIWIEDASKLCIKTENGDKCFATSDNYDTTKLNLNNTFNANSCNETTLGSATSLMYNCSEPIDIGYKGCYIQSMSNDRRYIACGLPNYSYKGKIGNLTCAVNNYTNNGYSYSAGESSYYCVFYDSENHYYFNNKNDEPYITE